jgi:hypothetical protein
VTGLGQLSRLYLQIVALGGTATAIVAYADFVRPGEHN